MASLMVQDSDHLLITLAYNPDHSKFKLPKIYSVKVAVKMFFLRTCQYLSQLFENRTIFVWYLNGLSHGPNSNHLPPFVATKLHLIFLIWISLKRMPCRLGQQKLDFYCPDFEWTNLPVTQTIYSAKIVLHCSSYGLTFTIWCFFN